MGLYPYEVVGTSIPADMEWEGKKVIMGVGLWIEYPTRYYHEEGWPYMGRGTP